MKLEYWEDKKNTLKKLYPKKITNFEAHMKTFIEFVDSTLRHDFSKYNIGLSFLYFIELVSCTNYSMNYVDTDPPTTHMAFRTLNEGLDNIVMALMSLKNSIGDEQRWKYIWRSLWVCVFKSLIDENQVIATIEDDIWSNYQSLFHNNNDTNNTNTINSDSLFVTIQTLRNKNKDWNSIAEMLDMEKDEVMEYFVSKLE